MESDLLDNPAKDNKRMNFLLKSDGQTDDIVCEKRTQLGMATSQAKRQQYNHYSCTVE